MKRDTKPHLVRDVSFLTREMSYSCVTMGFADTLDLFKTVILKEQTPLPVLL